MLFRSGIVVPNSFERDPLLQSPSFVADDHFPYLDFSGKFEFQFSLSPGDIISYLFFYL